MLSPGLNLSWLVGELGSTQIEGKLMDLQGFIRKAPKQDEWPHHKKFRAVVGFCFLLNAVCAANNYGHFFKLLGINWIIYIF